MFSLRSNKRFLDRVRVAVKSSNIVGVNCQEASVKTRILIVCFLLIGSLLAQTKSSPPEVAKPQAASDSIPSTGSVKIDAAKEADIRRLMDLAGTTQLALQMMDGMAKSIKPLMLNSFPPGDYREKLIDLFFTKFHSKAVPQQLLDMAVPAYDKYYTHEEI